ncbi:uncharacterized protein LOC107421019 [Ziziphus jujuba]|uniref:Uncharacterized protein LOC107421019 n=1 Tax=Ziziphus jujuba TaxID=326968 RepID=A0A6P3ZYF2_ZIZJJ|nr:uncharacterized protein LOC107421019 [Ziziphus jujuba]
MKRIFFVSFLLYFLVSLSRATPDHHEDSGNGGSSIVFTSLGRLDYQFDIFSLPISKLPASKPRETKITDGQSVNFNGHFPSSSSSSSSQTLIQIAGPPEPQSLRLVYVTERNGFSNIYYDEVYYYDDHDLEVSDRVQFPLLELGEKEQRISMKDRPSLVGDYLVYVSTHEDSGEPRTSSAAVYSTELKSGVTRRLTPYGVADYSPSVSPSGNWTAVASYGGKGWHGEIEELSTDIYVFLTRDGTRRVKVVQHGGWPCWVDESTLYFHRRGKDMWWSIYRAILPETGSLSTRSVMIERVTPPGLHVFTPATSPGNKNFIAVATRRPTSQFRHIELFDLRRNEFQELTHLVSPKTHHFNPFISPDSSRVGYHKCRGKEDGIESSNILFLQNLPSPIQDVSLFAFDGRFPSFSPACDRIAYAKFPGLFVVDLDGQNLRKVYDGNAFCTAWDPIRKGVIYTSAGPNFGSVDTEVDIVSINVDDVDQPTINKLTTNDQNNAFPSPSPDGKWIVFRSGRTGYKNLYIMDAEKGERSVLHRLTDGPWSDTMPNWSPDGEWIVFASDRHDPGNGSFELYLIHPNGTGFRKLVQSGSRGITAHPWFSPDGKRIVFTSDYGAISAEPISNPLQYQPYGEIFTINLDGSDLRRMTHNFYEDGTPVWVGKHIKAVDVVWPEDMPACDFEDLDWLNKMPSQGFEAKAMMIKMIKCGGSL